jgi:hypothetical protein
MADDLKRVADRLVLVGEHEDAETVLAAVLKLEDERSKVEALQRGYSRELDDYASRLDAALKEIESAGYLLAQKYNEAGTRSPD